MLSQRGSPADDGDDCDDCDDDCDEILRPDKSIRIYVERNYDRQCNVNRRVSQCIQ